MTTAPLRADVADPSGDRFRKLHAAQRVITSDLRLPVMLQRIVESARDIVGAHMVAMAVVDTDDVIEDLVHCGIDDDTASRLRDVATTATLNAMLDEWPTLTRTCPSGTVLPGAGVAAYLNVPIESGRRRFADLYVADPVSGEFTAGDREILQALARSAGAAIAHAKLVERATRSTEWLHASGEIARALLAEADVNLLHEVVERAVSAAGADYGQLITPGTAGDLRIIAAAGHGADAMLGNTYPADVSDIGRAVINGKTLRAPDVTPLLSSASVNKFDWGPVMIVPLLDAIGTRGSVIVARVSGRSSFTADELDLFATYASQVALTMQFAEARADAERMQVVETRHDTARELHDIVMQRLFATGVGLQSLATQLVDKEQAEQVARHVHDLDDTIDEIRNRVFGLQGDAHSAEPREAMFPRIALDATVTARDVAAAAPRPARRGRRRSDWNDGTGDRRS